MATNDNRFKNILVIHFGQIGDVVLGLPALFAIRRRFSDANITLMVGTSAATIARHAAVADDLIVVDRVRMRDGSKAASLRDIYRLVRDVRRRRFDLAIDLHSLSETNLLTVFAGISVRLFADRKGRSINRFSNYPVAPPSEDRARHAALRYLDVIRALGIEAEPKLEVPVSGNDLAHVCSAFAAAGLSRRPIVGICLGAGHPSRAWPIEKAARMAARLTEEDGADIAVFLGPEEQDLGSAVRTLFPKGTGIFAKFDLPQLMAALSLLDVFVSNDSGPAHIAAATRTPIVLVSHVGAPDEFLPLTERLSVVRDAPTLSIEVDVVLEQVQSWLRNDNRNSTW